MEASWIDAWPRISLPLEVENAERWYNMRHEETSGDMESVNGADCKCV